MVDPVKSTIERYSAATAADADLEGDFAAAERVPSLKAKAGGRNDCETATPTVGSTRRTCGSVSCDRPRAR
jgi:hypothetical protein